MSTARGATAATSAPRHDEASSAGSSFAAPLGAIALGGLALRIWYALRVPGKLDGDTKYYHLLANLIADGRWFVDPYILLFQGRSAPTAAHPPLWPLLLSGASALGGRSVDAHRIVGCVVGALTIVVLGLVGRRLLGNQGGLITAGFAAVYPNFWIPDGLLESGTLYVLLIAAFLLCSYRWLDRPTTGRALTLGAVLSLAILTRGEAAALFALSVVPMIALKRTLPWRARLRAVAATALAIMVIILPWAAFNVVRFDKLLLTTDSNTALGDANCAATYSGPQVGGSTIECRSASPPRPGDDEAASAARARQHALEYMGEHLGELPRVMVFRIARVWDFYKPDQNVRLTTVIQARDYDIGWWGEIMYWATLPIAAIGVFVLRRSRRSVLPLLAMFLLVTLTAAAVHGEIRLRAAAEVSMAVLAGAALTRMVSASPARAPRRSQVDGAEQAGADGAGR